MVRLEVCFKIIAFLSVPFVLLLLLLVVVVVVVVVIVVLKTPFWEFVFGHPVNFV